MEQDKVARVMTMFSRIVKRIDRKWKFPGGDVVVNYVTAGLKRLEDSFPMGMSDQRITDYMVYQLYRYADNISGVAPTHFQYSWCFSENALAKYRNQYFGTGNPRIDYYIDQWLDGLNITRQEITDFISGPKPNKWRKYIEMPSDEAVKRRFFNTRNGLILCSSKTMGWSPGSRACHECDFVEECKKITERRYPELLRLRLEEDGNN